MNAINCVVQRPVASLWFSSHTYRTTHEALYLVHGLTDRCKGKHESTVWVCEHRMSLLAVIFYYWFPFFILPFIGQSCVMCVSVLMAGTCATSEQFLHKGPH